MSKFLYSVIILIGSFEFNFFLQIFFIFYRKIQKENDGNKASVSNHPIKSLTYPNGFGLVELPTNSQLRQVNDVLKKMKENK